MNKALAHILKQQLAAIQFVDKLAGMVQVVEFPEMISDEAIPDNPIQTKIIKRIPISCDVDLADCDFNHLVPDSNKKGILYFEDNGVTANGKENDYIKYVSRLRLVCWLNTRWIKNENCIALSAILINYCINRIDRLQLTNHFPFIRLNPIVDTIPKQDKAIFSAYTYDQQNTQYLMSPFEFFAIDYRIEFMMQESCIEQLQIKTLEEYLNEQNCST